ncbi:uncharacterized protein LOC111245140 isoform X2 [Varroa destructor]|uniref:Uncharacterized protein n=1 Tax=Varroa destructor TaxID=109461 RepID=A0A7M7MAY9_VARDE|nr:uncharacterized protein LOC111245140 isoform X2 [Varroa destructor]
MCDVKYDGALVIILVLNLLFWLIIIVWRFCYIRNLNTIIERRRAEMRGQINDGLQSDMQENQDNLFYSLSRSDFPPSYDDAIKSHLIISSAGSGLAPQSTPNPTASNRTSVVMQALDNSGVVRTSGQVLASYATPTVPTLLNNSTVTNNAGHFRTAATAGPTHSTTERGQAHPLQRQRTQRYQSISRQQGPQQQSEPENDFLLEGVQRQQASSVLTDCSSGNPSTSAQEHFCAATNSLDDTKASTNFNNDNHDKGHYHENSNNSFNKCGGEMKKFSPVLTSATASVGPADADTCESHHVKSYNSMASTDGEHFENCKFTGCSDNRLGEANHYTVEMRETASIALTVAAAAAEDAITVTVESHDEDALSDAVVVKGRVNCDDEPSTSFTSEVTSKLLHETMAPPPLPTSPIPDA